MNQLATSAAVRAHCKEPHEMALRKKIRQLDRHCRDFVAAAPLRVISLPAVFAVALLAASAASEAIDPGVVIADRAAKLKEMGSAFKGMNDELRRLDPDMKIVRNDAKLLHGYSTELPGWFPAGTGTESGLKTRAKPDVWEKAAAFAAAAKNFQTEAANLQKLVADTDIDAVKLQAKSVAAACGACHTEFRTAD